MDDGHQRGIGQDSIPIRVAAFMDAEAIADCLRAAFAQHRAEYTPEAYADTVLSSDGVLRRLQEMLLFVAVSDAKIVGTIGCMVNGSEGHLRGMAVLPD